jgi:tRNA nucleotidyltransferase (CCA-adding enzyme)
LDEMAEIRPQDETALLMSLAHDLGKSTTDEEDLPSHPAHGKHGVPVVEKMADRLSMSNEQKNAMRAACRHHMKMQDIGDLRESTVINLVEEEDMETIFRLIDLVEADAAGRMPEGEADVGKMFARVFAAGAAIEHWTGEHLIDEGYNPAEMGGEEFGDLLHQKRVEFMREIEQ